MHSLSNAPEFTVLQAASSSYQDFEILAVFLFLLFLLMTVITTDESYFLFFFYYKKITLQSI